MYQGYMQNILPAPGVMYLSVIDGMIRTYH